MLTDTARLKKLQMARELISDVSEDIENAMPDMHSKASCRLNAEIQDAIAALDKAYARLFTRAGSHPPVEKPLISEERLINVEKTLGKLRERMAMLEAGLRGEIDMRTRQDSTLFEKIENERSKAESQVKELEGRLDEHQNTAVGEAPGQGTHNPIPF